MHISDRERQGGHLISECIEENKRGVVFEVAHFSVVVVAVAALF